MVHDSKGVIEPVAPGHIESYDLNANGKVTFRESIRFHKTGEPPAYKTLVSSLGKYSTGFAPVIYDDDDRVPAQAKCLYAGL